MNCHLDLSLWRMPTNSQRTRRPFFSKRRSVRRWFDMRDLGAVLDHEEPLPHPACDQAQTGAGTGAACCDSSLWGVDACQVRAPHGAALGGLHLL